MTLNLLSFASLSSKHLSCRRSNGNAIGLCTLYGSCSLPQRSPLAPKLPAQALVPSPALLSALDVLLLFLCPPHADIFKGRDHLHECPRAAKLLRERRWRILERVLGPKLLNLRDLGLAERLFRPLARGF